MSFSVKIENLLTHDQKSSISSGLLLLPNKNHTVCLHAGLKAETIPVSGGAFFSMMKNETNRHTFGSAFAGKSGSNKVGISSVANTCAGGRHSSVDTVPTFCPLARATSSV